MQLGTSRLWETFQGKLPGFFTDNCKQTNT